MPLVLQRVSSDHSVHSLTVIVGLRNQPNTVLLRLEVFLRFTLFSSSQKAFLFGSLNSLLSWSGSCVFLFLDVEIVCESRAVMS